MPKYKYGTGNLNGSFPHYQSSNSLVLWVSMTGGSPTNKSSRGLSPIYVASPAHSMVYLGNREYNAATFVDSSDAYAQVVASSGILSFSTVGDEGTPTSTSDEPFSISCWVKLDGGGFNFLFEKDRASSTNASEYSAYIYSGKIYFEMQGGDWGAPYVQLRRLATQLATGVWYNLIFTYDGRGGASANRGMNIYVDGSKVTDLDYYAVGAYAGMKPDYSAPLRIGARASEYNTLDGQMAEFAVWSSELSALEVTAIYNATRRFADGSGYLNNPARTLLRDQDNHTGSYPTVARTGDPDFLGTGNVFFDDTKTIEYFSSYATAQIEFAGFPRDADAIMLTGSTAASKRLFEFQRGVLRRYTGAPSPGGFSGEIVDSALVDITGSDQTAFTAAHAFAETVNSASMGIEATTLGSIVKLRQHEPMLGTYALGNLIGSASASPVRPIPVIVTQFKQLGPENYLYPVMLPIGSPHMSSSVATPNTLTTLEAPAIMGSNTSGVGITFTPGEKLTPFNETRIPMDNDDDFYTIGTPSTVLPGFNARLSSKTSIDIDCTPAASFSLFWSTGTNPNASGFGARVSSGLAYFNFSQKRWEPTGDLSTGSNVDHLAKDVAIFTASMLATSPGREYMMGINLDAVGDRNKLTPLIGTPINNTGFPVASKFDATSSHFIDMSDYITVPFLLEKVLLEVSGAFPSPPACNASFPPAGKITQPTVTTFMLLNQFETELFGSSSRDQHKVTINPDVITKTVGAFPVSKQKDIVWYARVGVFSTHATKGFVDEKVFQDTDPDKYAAAEVWIPDAGGNPSYAPIIASNAPTASVSLGFPTTGVPFAPMSNPPPEYAGKFRSGSRGMQPAGDSFFLGTGLGGRELFSLSDGRSYIGSSIGGDPTGGEITYTNYTSDTPVITRLYDFERRPSPYLLLPTDKLVLAVAFQMYPDEALNGPFTERLTSNMVVKLADGIGKLVFYGSQLRDGKPVDFTLNQPLTSDAIHEDVRDDISPYGEARCLDQFDVDPATSFRGGYLDNIITGSMYGSQFADPLVAPTRTVVASVVDGQAGITGSLQRFVRVNASNEKFYDSYPPNIIDVLFKVGAGLYAFGVDGASIAVGTHAYAGDHSPPIDRNWYRRHAYEAISVRHFAQSLQDIRAEAFNHAGVSQGSRILTRTRSMYVFLGDAKDAGGGSLTPLISDDDGNIDTPASLLNTMKALFGFGDSWYGPGHGHGGGAEVNGFLGRDNTPTWIGRTLARAPIGTSEVVVPVIRGVKYGLLNWFPTAPSAIFRHDTFGQFRDMLEARPQARFFEGTELGEPPVSITFFDRDGTPGISPESTNSQNLSLFATSSVPYSDMPSDERDWKTVFGRDRATIQPDLDPDENLDITTS